jgi:hypothetical protein
MLMQNRKLLGLDAAALCTATVGKKQFKMTAIDIAGVFLSKTLCCIDVFAPIDHQLFFCFARTLFSAARNVAPNYFSQLLLVITQPCKYFYCHRPSTPCPVLKSALLATFRRRVVSMSILLPHHVEEHR